MKLSSWLAISAPLIAVATLPTIASGHAFPFRSEPRVGWTISAAPAKVTIWFDGELEAAFSSIMIYNSARQQVDKGNSRVNGASVLEVDLSPLAPGVYRVYWKVLAKDTHVTEGDFSFTLEKKKP